MTEVKGRGLNWTNMAVRHTCGDALGCMVYAGYPAGPGSQSRQSQRRG